MLSQQHNAEYEASLYPMADPPGGRWPISSRARRARPYPRHPQLALGPGLWEWEALVVATLLLSIGWSDSMSAPRYPVCAAALDACEVIAIDSVDFAKMLRESVDTCFVVMGALSMRLRSLRTCRDD